MLSDNGNYIFRRLRNKKAIFIKGLFGGKVHYMATNRAARRFLRSKGVQGTVDLSTESVS